MGARWLGPDASLESVDVDQLLRLRIPSCDSPGLLYEDVIVAWRFYVQASVVFYMRFG